MASYKLIARRGPRAGEIFELESQTIIVGRDATADISINDPEVSRNHCRLILESAYYIQDLGSTNGTFVDGQRLGGEPIRLVDGQIIQLGSNVTLLFKDETVEIDLPPVHSEAAEVDEYDEEEGEEEPWPAAAPPAGRAAESWGAPETAYEAASPIENENRPPEKAAGATDVHGAGDGYSRRTYQIIIAVLVVLLLCTCCVATAGVVYYLQTEGLIALFQGPAGGLAGTF